MKKSKVVEFYENLIKRARRRLAQSQKDYTDVIDAKLRFFLKHGFFDETLREREMDAYLKVAKITCDLVYLEEKLIQIKGNEGFYYGKE